MRRDGDGVDEKQGGEWEDSAGGDGVSLAASLATLAWIALLPNLDPGRPSLRISAHSTRIGAAQDLTAAGAAPPENDGSHE
jgi:hypothetical protein